MGGFYETLHADASGDTPVTWRNKVHRIKHKVYEALYILFSANGGKNHRRKHQRLYLTLINVFTGVQLVSLLELGGESVVWDDHSEVWGWLLYFRLDYVCHQLGVLNECIFVTQGAVVALLLMFCWACFQSEDHVSTYIKLPIQIGFFVLFQLLFIPVLIFCELNLFQGIVQQTERWSAVEKSAATIPLALLSVCCTCILKYVDTVSRAELRHTSKSLLARAHSNVDLLAVRSRLATVTFFVASGAFHPHYFLVVMFVSEAYLCYQFIWQLPYYHHSTTQVKAAVSAAVAFCSFAFLLGSVMGNAGVTLLLSLLVTPLVVLLLVTKGFEARLRLVRSVTLQTLDSCSTHFDLERRLRKKLMNTTMTPKTEVVTLLSRYFNSASTHRKTLLIVWEANFCMYAMKDERLARIKLSKRLLTHFEFESDYQAFLCNKTLDEFTTEILEDNEFLQFKLKLEQTKKEDLNVCYTFYKIIEELEEPALNLNKISTLLHSFDTSNNTVMDMYKELIQKYVDGQEVSALYSSYLTQILKEEDLAEQAQQRGAAASSHLANRQLSYFDNRNGLMIVSGDFNSLGTIVFANETMSLILDEPTSSITGNNISSYIPFPYSVNHNKNLERYLLNCTNTNIDVPSSTFITNQAGHLIEVKLKIQCIASGASAFFLVLLQAKTVERDVLLLDNQGLVVGHTAGAPQVFRLTELIGLDMSTYVPQADLALLEDYDEIAVDQHTRLVFRKKKNVNVYMKYFHVYSTLPRHSFSESVPILERPENIPEKSLKFIDNSDPNQRVEDVFTGPATSPPNSSTQNMLRSMKVRRLQDSLQRLLSRLSVLIVTLLVIFTASSVALIIFTTSYDNHVEFDNILEQSQAIVHAYFEAMDAVRLIELSQEDPELVSKLKVKRSELLETIGTYKALETDMLDTLDHYPDLLALLHQEIPYWDCVGPITIEYNQPSNVIDQFIFKASNYQPGDTRALQFIVMNGAGFPYAFLRTLADRVASSNLYDQSYMLVQFRLILFGAFGLALSTLVITGQCIFRIQRQSQEYWKEILQQYKSNNLRVKADLLRRFEMVHSVEAEPFHKSERESLPKVPMILLQYFWGFSVVVVSISSYLLLIYYIYAELKVSPTLERFDYYIELLKYKRNLNEVSFWTHESLLWDSDQSLVELLDNTYPFMSAAAQFWQAEAEVRSLQTSLLDDSSSVVTTREATELFHDSTADTVGLLQKSSLLLTESSNYLDSDKSFTDYLTLAQDVDTLKGAIDDFNAEFLEESLTFKNQRQNIVLVVAVLGWAANILFVGVLLFAFTQRKKKLLKCKAELYNIIAKNKVQDGNDVSDN